MGETENGDYLPEIITAFNFEKKKLIARYLFPKEEWCDRKFY